MRYHAERWVLWAAAWLCSTAALAQSEPDVSAVASASETVAALHRALGAFSGPPKGEQEVEERYEALVPVVGATHDLPYIARFTLGRRWSELDEGQQQRFVDAFERLSVMNYAARFASLEEDAIRIRGERVDGEQAQVSAAISRVEQPDVPLEYVLQRRPEGWRIVNVLADGVSDLALKRAEYQRVLAEGSPETLIAHLTAQTAALVSQATQRRNR